MNRKKFKWMMVGFLQFVVVLCMRTLDVSAASAKTIDRDLSVVYCDTLDIAGAQTTVTEDPYTDLGRYLETGESYIYRYRFTIDQISYVKFHINSRVAVYNFTGYYNVYLGTAPDDRTFSLATDKWVDGTAPVDYTTALEGGVYYLTVETFDKDPVYDNNNPIPGGYLSVGIQAQKLQRTGNVSGRTKEDAIPVVGGSSSTGVISGVTSEGKFSVCAPTQWFSFTANGKFDMNAAVVVSRPADFDTTQGLSAKLYNAQGMLITSQLSSNSNSVMLVSSDLPAGNYFIEAVYPRFCQITVSPDITITQKAQLAQPTSFKAIAGKKKVTLKWKKCTKAAKYQIYRSTKKTIGYRKIGTTKNTSYVDRKGLKSKSVYYYKVRAINPELLSSNYSKTVKVRVK